MISNDPGNTKTANKEEQPNKLGFVSWCLQEPNSDRGHVHAGKKMVKSKKEQF